MGEGQSSRSSMRHLAPITGEKKKKSPLVFPSSRDDLKNYLAGFATGSKEKGKKYGMKMASDMSFLKRNSLGS